MRGVFVSNYKGIKAVNKYDIKKLPWKRLFPNLGMELIWWIVITKCIQKVEKHVRHRRTFFIISRWYMHVFFIRTQDTRIVKGRKSTPISRGKFNSIHVFIPYKQHRILDGGRHLPLTQKYIDYIYFLRQYYFRSTTIQWNNEACFTFSNFSISLLKSFIKKIKTS